MKKHTRKMALVASLVILLLMISVPAAFASGGTHHKVHYGDTLFSIGRAYGVNPYAIAEVNNLVNPHHIYAGQVLYIPTYQQPYNNCSYGCDWQPDGHHNSYYQDSYYSGGYYQGGYYQGGYQQGGYYQGGYGYSGPGHHRVVAGETLSSIAYHYGVNSWAIASANHLANPNYIYVGQVLVIPMHGPAYGYY
jgi:LysM repeat protein